MTRKATVQQQGSEEESLGLPANTLVKAAMPQDGDGGQVVDSNGNIKSLAWGDGNTPPVRSADIDTKGVVAARFIVKDLGPKKGQYKCPFNPGMSHLHEGQVVSETSHSLDAIRAAGIVLDPYVES